MSLHAPIAARDAERPALDRLHAALALIDCLAGTPGSTPSPDPDAALRHARAPAIARRRHDALAREAAAFAAAGIAGLLRCKERDGIDPAPAAARLARELRAALEGLARAIG